MKTKTTTADIADLVEYAINETKPIIKTQRGSGNEVKLEVGRDNFILTVKRFKKEEIEGKNKKQKGSVNA